jgi:uncharacterized membrane protein YgcG
MKLHSNLFLLWLFAAAVGTIHPSLLTAQRTLVIERLESELRVDPAGDLHVTETLRPRFQGSWNGIYRDVSLEHETAEGRRERLDLDLVSITDGEGNALRYETPGQGRWTRRFQVWVPGARDATRTVVIRYVVHNGLRFFEADSEVGPLDELYWNVTGNDWEVPIEAAVATVLLPEGVTPTQSAGYTGPAGSTETAVRVETRENRVTFTATRRLGPGEGLTVATGWPPGAVARPSPVSGVTRGFALWWPLSFPFLAFFLAFRQWKRTGRDPEARAIPVQWEPPEGLGPAEVGTLVDHKAEMHDITATLVDLAVRGYVHIEQLETKALGIFSQTEYRFHLKKPRGDWGELNTHEMRYLSGVFKHAGGAEGIPTGGDGSPPDTESEAAASGAGEGPTYGTVDLSDLKNEFYKDLKGIRKALYEQLIQKGHYERDPERAKAPWLVGGLLLLAASIGLAIWVSDAGALAVQPLAVAVGGGLSGLVFLTFGQIMPARTVPGARAREWALGFKEFLERVEEDRFQRMITSPEMFERYLAFAMAFQVESKWARAFEDMYTEPPRWYTGPHGAAFHASSFTSDLSAMSSAASSTMSSSPSGSGGGGSSGGGSGGGGGGGF